MKKLLILLLFPLMIFAQESTLIGDVDCSGEVDSQDASLILQFVTNLIDELPCQGNMTGLTPEQLQEMISLMNEQLNINFGGGGDSTNPIMMSSLSSENMTWGNALIYCTDLEEDGYSDWFLPTVGQLTYSVSGGCTFPDERTDNTLWTRSPSAINDSYIYAIQESGGGIDDQYWNNSYQCRCVRFGESETNQNLINYSSPGSSISVNSEQPITMIGPMYIESEYPDFTAFANSGQEMYYLDAIRFCSQLVYNDYDDWVLPTFSQIINYIEQNQSSFILANNTDFDIYSFWLKHEDIENSSGYLSAPYIGITGSAHSTPNQTAFIHLGFMYADYKSCFCAR